MAESDELPPLPRDAPTTPQALERFILIVLERKEIRDANADQQMHEDIMNSIDPYGQG